MNRLPLVSICSITYNHAPYIRQCLDGMLMQQTNFAFEIIINDDCSTDGTTEIIREYAEKYPEIIKPIFHDENQYQKGLRGFFHRFVFPKAQGKYIALCEGDDYWTDPLKLQKQVDFLESHPDYGMVYTDLKTFSQKEKSFITTNYQFAEGNIYDKYLAGNIQIWTVTVCFRKKYIQNLPTLNTNKYFTGDIFIYSLICYHSKVKFLNEKTCVYRVLENSASHFNGNKKAAYYFAYKVFNTKLYLMNMYPLSDTNIINSLTKKIIKARIKYALSIGDYNIIREPLNKKFKISNLKDFKLKICLILLKYKFFFNLIAKYAHFI